MLEFLWTKKGDRAQKPWYRNLCNTKNCYKYQYINYGILEDTEITLELP